MRYKMLRLGVVCFVFLLTQQVFAQRISRREYVESYKDLALKEMKRSGIPASITLAQGILESDCGNSVLAKKSNNHFGIKCHNDWTGGKVYHDDDRKNECFRKYKSVYESFVDHSDFLTG
ncbi:MAG: glucosaminidase domain-containing protein, partial [Breznakibacter sp.]|nr:glucosaminidase domain-containing protein [Breznakibacter sp.]